MRHEGQNSTKWGSCYAKILQTRFQCFEYSRLANSTRFSFNDLSLDTKNTSIQSQLSTPKTLILTSLNGLGYNFHVWTVSLYNEVQKTVLN